MQLQKYFTALISEKLIYATKHINMKLDFYFHNNKPNFYDTRNIFSCS